MMVILHPIVLVLVANEFCWQIEPPPAPNVQKS